MAGSNLDGTGDDGSESGDSVGVDSLEPASLFESGVLNGSATRLEILQVLTDRQRTAPETARELDMDRSGVYRHLESLAEAGYVDRVESDRKWVYYALTNKGQALLRLDSNGALILVVLATAGFVGYIVLRWWLQWRTWKERTGTLDAPQPIPEPSFPVLTVAIAVPVGLALTGANRWILRHAT